MSLDLEGSTPSPATPEPTSPEPSPSALPDTVSSGEPGSIRESIVNAYNELATEEEVDPDASSSPSPDASPEAPAVEPEEEVPAPASWNAQEKEEFAKLPLDIKKAVARREREREAAMTRKSQSISDQHKRFVALKEALTPQLETLDLKGETPEQYLTRLIAADRVLTTRPKDGFKHLLNLYSVDPLDLIGEESNQPEPSAPEMVALQQKVDQLISYVQQQQASTQSSHLKTVEEETRSFALAKDSNGQPLRPHFERVGAELVEQYEYMRAKDPTLPVSKALELAYERAVYLDPEVRELEFRRQEKIRIEAEKAKAQASRQSAQSVKGAPNGVATKQPPDSIRGLLEAALYNR